MVGTNEAKEEKQKGVKLAINCTLLCPAHLFASNVFSYSAYEALLQTICACFPFSLLFTTGV